MKFKPGVSEEEVKNITEENGTQVTYTSPYAGFKIMEIPKTKTVEEMMEIYSKNPNVEYAIPNVIMNALMVPNDPYYGLYQWNFKAFETGVGGGINLEPAWNISTGKGVIVAVLDTGVAYENYSIYKKKLLTLRTLFLFRVMTLSITMPTRTMITGMERMLLEL